MRYPRLFVHSVLLLTIPSTAAFPQTELPIITVRSHTPSPKNTMVQKLLHGNSVFTYDEVITLLKEIENGALEKKCSEKDLSRVNQFLANLAREGLLSNNIQEKYQLACDVQDLLDESTGYEYAFSYGIDDMIVPLLDSHYGEYILCKKHRSAWVKIKKFVKKHKKAIIIGAAIVVAAAVIVYTYGAGTPVAVAGVNETIKSQKEDNSSKEKSAAPPSPGNPSDNSDISIRETPWTKPAFDELANSFKYYAEEERNFLTPYESTLPIDFSIEENGRILGSVFAHRHLEQAHSPGTLGLSTPETANWKALEHQYIDEAYATDFGKYYTGSTQNSFSMGTQTDLSADLYQIRGNLALDYAHYDQAISDLGKTLELNPYNPDAYFGRAKAHLAKGDYDRSLEDYREYEAQKPAPLGRIVDFSIGFAKGLPKGAYESGSQLASFAYDLLAHPIDTGREVCEAFTIMSKLVYTQEWETIGKALSPEIHQLITEWDTLSPQEQGERAGYAFGKHGADLLLPGVIAKTASRAAAGGQEILAAYRTLNAAEKTLVLETVARSGASGEELLEIAAKLAKGERSTLGTLESTLTERARAQSVEAFKKAQDLLKPYQGRYLAEGEAIELLQNAGIKTFPRPKGIPDSFKIKISEKGGGLIYEHPENIHNSVRVMPGKPHSPNPSQQKPYVVQMKDGKAIDKFGNRIPPTEPEAHISLEEFVYIDK